MPKATPAAETRSAPATSATAAAGTSRAAEEAPKSQAKAGPPPPRLVAGRVGQEDAEALVHAAPDAAAQLVQLREPEAVGLLDHHEHGVRHVDADLDDGRGDEHVELAGAEGAHGLLPLAGGHL